MTQDDSDSPRPDLLLPRRSGSGSTYIYGYCDSTWRPGWGREQTLEFVKNALSLAMSRDGSSGGTIRMVDITEKGVQRHFIPGVSTRTDPLLRPWCCSMQLLTAFYKPLLPAVPFFRTSCQSSQPSLYEVSLAQIKPLFCQMCEAYFAFLSTVVFLFCDHRLAPPVTFSSRLQSRQSAEGRKPPPSLSVRLLSDHLTTLACLSFSFHLFRPHLTYTDHGRLSIKGGSHAT